MASDLKFWNAINLVGNIGPQKFKKLINFFPNMEAAWLASPQDLKRTGLGEEDIALFYEKRKTINPDLEFEKLKKEKITLLTLKDKNYPKLLAEIYDPPAILYIKGNFKDEDQPTIGVVGTRKMSLYGKQITQQLVYDLAKAGMIIVSGLAFGIDTQAHLAAISASQKTYAILGSGLDEENIYPQSNLSLAKKIIDGNGALISEYPCGTPAFKQNFPQRNRIISGLAQAILVTECPESSGALITCQYALEQNRDVFACPGSIFWENSKGTNRLIQEGAKLVTCAQEIIEELNLNLILPKKQKISPANREEEKILNNLLDGEPIHIDFLAQKTKIPIPKLTSLLAKMEIESKVKNIGGMNYVKK